MTGIRIKVACALSLLGVFGGFVQPRIIAQTKPSTRPALQPGWDQIDQRLVFFTVELATVESTIDATNKALKVSGYKQTQRQEAADRARAANVRMDRNGGGPVAWQEFYGRTATTFFYHPVDPNTGYINPPPVSQRPAEFDYMYRANEQQRLDAEAELHKLGNKSDDLLNYRRRWEREQSKLWQLIAFRGEAALEIPSRPMYRSGLHATADDDLGKETAVAANAAATFIKNIDSEMLAVQSERQGDQTAQLEKLLQSTLSARSAFQDTILALPKISSALSDPKSPISTFAKAARRLEDSAQNAVDANRLANECDVHEDNTGKQVYRRQLQQMLIDFAATVSTADQSLSGAVAAWKLAVNVAPPPTATTDPSATPEDISETLDQAKLDHKRQVAAAHRDLIKVIADRINAASDAGNLDLVQSLQRAQAKATADGDVPADTSDPAILAAVQKTAKAIEASDVRLVAAYRDAIVHYTRSRRLTEAKDVQTELKASGLAGALVSPDGKVYLSDMTPVSVSTFHDGSWGFGINGDLGNHQDRITVNNVLSPHGLGVHPPSSGASTVVYRLDGKYSLLTGKGAINDNCSRSSTALIFRINGDSNELWRGRPIQVRRAPQEFKIDVTGINTLELVVDCPGSHDNAHAVWFEPALTPATSSHAGPP